MNYFLWNYFLWTIFNGLFLWTIFYGMFFTDYLYMNDSLESKLGIRWRINKPEAVVHFVLKFQLERNYNHAVKTHLFATLSVDAN